MIQLNDPTIEPGATQPTTEYERNQRRKSLYRVLAANIVRELREAGHHGHELLEFASEVIQAITDNGWEAPSSGRASNTSADRIGNTLNIVADPYGRPTITGRKTVLRPPTAADAEHLAAWLKEPLVRTSLVPPVLCHVLAHIADPAPEANRVDLMVCDRPTGAAIGLVSLHDIDRTVGQAALAKMIGNPEFRGKGVAHEATELILSYGFETLDLHRIYLRTLGGSLQNIKLNERLGFRFEGVLEDAAISEGRHADVILMAMLRSEFRVQVER